MQINNELVGNRIKKIRSEKGMSQEEFGLLIKKAHKSLVSKWEKGQSLPNNERLKRIAELGEMTVEELLHGDELLSNMVDYVYDLITETEELNDEVVNEKALNETIKTIREEYRELKRDNLSISDYEDERFRDHVYGIYDNFCSKYPNSEAESAKQFDNLLKEIEYFGFPEPSYNLQDNIIIITFKGMDTIKYTFKEMVSLPIKLTIEKSLFSDIKAFNYTIDKKDVSGNLEETISQSHDAHFNNFKEFEKFCFSNFLEKYTTKFNIEKPVMYLLSHEFNKGLITDPIFMTIN
ncbi:helix-turn-helix domain-containing protein [Carnobacterium sp. FSL W8-0810]|uniref:helix-turn-helix domain-containing protein n=1 Tax=Carnobacterium sp. FSL W8-0810 TaxID=2954705 RepID=UPI0030F97B2A